MRPSISPTCIFATASGGSSNLACCRAPMPPMPLRSCSSRRLAMVQPLLSCPTRCDAGTCTFSKNVSQNTDLPLISLIGRGRTPGSSMSISRKLMPSCFFTVGSVRTRQKIQSDRCALEVHILWPFTRKCSPCSTARVDRLARSDPDPGSEYPWHQRISPEIIFGRCVWRCSSVPYSSSVGPNIDNPMPRKGARQPRSCISSSRIRASSAVSPPPPYFFGHVGAVHPFAAIRSSQIFCSGRIYSARLPPATCSSSGMRVRMAGGQFSSSQARLCARKVVGVVIRCSLGRRWEKFQPPDGAVKSRWHRCSGIDIMRSCRTISTTETF